MSLAAEYVRAFHRFFDQPSRSTPTRIVGEELEFRKTLIDEEREELFEALDGTDFRAMYKEMADLAYVLYGLDQHMGGYLDQAVEAVHASNMSKLWDCEKCGGTGFDAGRGVGCSACMDSAEPGKIARYREDGKVLKPPTYTTADLSFLPEEAPEATDAES